MKSILKYGLIGGILILIAAYLPLLPYVNLYFDASIIGAMKFVIFGGVMLFAINDFLKYDERKNEYTYGKGFLICLGTGFLSFVIFSILFLIVQNLLSNTVFLLAGLRNLILYELPLIFFLSLITPLTFRNRKTDGDKPERVDILDADL